MNRPSETTSRSLLDFDSTLMPALASSVLCWLAFPPFDLSWLVWLAPIGWLSLVTRDTLSGRRPYRALWLSGFVFWTLTVHWLRLPHPVNYIALVALASYLGCYLPAFVAIARVGVHRLGLPLWLVAPTVWTGLDWFRHHLITGFGLGSLAHTQIRFLEIIQLADIVGEYGVTFLIMLVSACLTLALSHNRQRHTRPRLRHVALYLILGSLAIGSAFVHGALFLQLEIVSSRSASRMPRIALIQGNTHADWKNDIEKQRNIMDEYMGLSSEAVANSQAEDDRPIDLIIWPETSFRQSLATVEAGYQLPAGIVHESYLTAGPRDLATFVNQTGAAILTGIDRVHIYPTDHGHPDFKTYNSSVLMDAEQRIVGTYDKMHLVVFGEYVPFSDWFPLLRRLTPITGMAEPGKGPVAMKLQNLVFCPNICYETVVPHLIRRQVTELAAAGEMPDVLVNLTNDAWFWGSSELDMHLACGVFRAVEHKRPLLIAANGGLSAHVGPSGAVHQVTERQKPQTLLVDLPQPSQRGLTLYAKWGDWFAGICVVCCVVLAVVGWRGRVRDAASSEATPRG